MRFGYHESGDGYLARLEYTDQRTETAPNVGEKVGEKLTNNQQAILKCMQDNPAVAAKEISELIGISLRKTEENIKKLREHGLIERIGPARGGHWDVRS